MATCNCLGKLKGCTCDGRCACECTCKKTYYTDDDGKDHPLFVEYDCLYEIKEGEENVWPNGNCNEVKHKTRGGKGVIGQALARYKKLPPNCS